MCFFVGPFRQLLDLYERGDDAVVDGVQYLNVEEYLKAL